MIKVQNLKHAVSEELYFYPTVRSIELIINRMFDCVDQLYCFVQQKPHFLEVMPLSGD